MPACPGYRDRLPSLLRGPGEEGLQAHVRACAGCAAELEVLKGLEADLASLGSAAGLLETSTRPAFAAPRRRWVPWAAAAALLLLGGWFWNGKGRERPAEEVPGPEVASVSWPLAEPGAPLAGGPKGLRVLWPGTGGVLNLGPGAEARLGASGQALALVTGKAWARLEGPFRIETPQGVLSGDSATLALAVAPRSGEALSWLFRGALADAGPSVRVALLEGRAAWVSPEGREVPLVAGQETRVSAGVPGPGIPVDARWFADLAPAWRPAGAGDEAALAGTSRLPGGGWRLEPGAAPAALFWAWPPGEGEWEVVYRPAGRSTVAAVFRVGGELREWMLHPSPSAAEVRVRLGRQGGWISGSLDGRLLWRCPEDSPSLGRFSGTARQGDVGILAWGDPVTVATARRSDAELPGVVVGSGR